MAMSDLESEILKVLRDGGAANVDDIPSLLEGVPRGTDQSSLVVGGAAIREALHQLRKRGFVIDREPGVVAWSGVEFPGCHTRPDPSAPFELPPEIMAARADEAAAFRAGEMDPEDAKARPMPGKPRGK